jgi:hypothetical protein
MANNSIGRNMIIGRIKIIDIKVFDIQTKLQGYRIVKIK